MQYVIMFICVVLWTIYLVGAVYSFFEGLYYWNELGFRSFDDLLQWAGEWPKVFIIKNFF